MGQEMNRYEQSTSGLFVPSVSQEIDDQMDEMVKSPMMQFLIRSIFNAWTVNDQNYMIAWNSPVYVQLSTVQGITMQGIDLIKEANNLPQSKGWAITSMLARAINIARLACLSLALGSLSDAFSNYRLLLEREMTLVYLDAKNEYDAFAKAFYAEIYQRGNKGLNDAELRANYTAEELKNSKDMMELIRTKFFDNKPPKAPGHYWKRPTPETLAEVYAKSPTSGPDDLSHRLMMRAYELGNRNVHPQLRDMLQPEDSDISPRVLDALVLTTLAGASTFGLSRFEESAHLASEIERILTEPTNASWILEMMPTERK